MIEISGSTQFSFVFPADRQTAYEFYSDVNRIISFLPLIQLVSASDHNQYRILFSSVELGAYSIHIFCDVRMELVPGQHLWRLLAADQLPPITSKASLNSTTARGQYRSVCQFKDMGANETEIDYQLELYAKLLRPKGLRFMPKGVVNKIANNIALKRTQEIAEGFVVNSVRQFTQDDSFDYQLKMI